MEKPTKEDLIKGLDQIDSLIRGRLNATPDEESTVILLAIREIAQDLINKILALFKVT